MKPEARDALLLTYLGKKHVLILIIRMKMVLFVLFSRIYCNGRRQALRLALRTVSFFGVIRSFCVCISRGSFSQKIFLPAMSVSQ